MDSAKREAADARRECARLKEEVARCRQELAQATGLGSSVGGFLRKLSEAGNGGGTPIPSQAQSSLRTPQMQPQMQPQVQPQMQQSHTPQAQQTYSRAATPFAPSPVFNKCQRPALSSLPWSSAMGADEDPAIANALAFLSDVRKSKMETASSAPPAAPTTSIPPLPMPEAKPVLASLPPAVVAAAAAAGGAGCRDLSQSGVSGEFQVRTGGGRVGALKAQIRLAEQMELHGMSDGMPDGGLPLPLDELRELDEEEDDCSSAQPQEDDSTARSGHTARTADSNSDNCSQSTDGTGRSSGRSGRSRTSSHSRSSRRSSRSEVDSVKLRHSRSLRSNQQEAAEGAALPRVRTAKTGGKKKSTKLSKSRSAVTSTGRKTLLL